MKNLSGKKTVRKWILSAAFLLSGITAYSQQTVSGTVSDNQKEPLTGVTVLIKGTSTGTLTDIDGKYSIKTTDEKAVLVFSYIGYQSQEIAAAGKSVIHVVLSEESYQLEEFVAIGYGSVRKKDLTASVASVDMSDLLKAPVSSFDQALAGRVAGVQVTQGDGEPGSISNIVIRGGNSITQDNSPLYVIDGFPVENPDNSVYDPANIESIDVLKDASATAIYGARGANGVIIITTKKGKEGPPRITFDGYYGIQSEPKKMELLDGYEFVQLMNDIDPERTAETYLLDRPMEYYKTAPYYDWQDMVFRSGFDAPIQNYSLNLSGGTQNTKYSAGLSYYDQDGIIINSSYNIWRFRGTLDQQINSRLKIGTSVNYSESRSNGSSPSQGSTAWSSTQYFLWSVWSYRPVAYGDIDLLNELYDPDIDMGNDYRFNPVKTIENEYAKRTSSQINLNGYATYNILKGLDFKTIFSYQKRTDKIEKFNNSQTYWGDPNYRAEGINGSIYFKEWGSWSSENTLTYKNKFNKVHNFTGMLGFSLSRKDTDYFGAGSILIPQIWENQGIYSLDKGVPNSITNDGTYSTMASFFGRINYDFKSRYLATATFRADGSSRFPDNKKWGYFPSFALAWRLSEEAFIKNQNWDWLSNIKLRGGWGITGNDRTNSDFNNSRLYNSTHYSFNNTIYPGIYPSNVYAEEKLRWESTHQTDIGIDIGLLNNRVEFVADIYRKDTKDLLFEANIPPSIGFKTSMQNIGQVRNEGLELTLSTVNLTGGNNKLKWTTNFNISFNRNKVIALSGGEQSLAVPINWDSNWLDPCYIARVGQPISQIYGYVFDGVYQYEDFNEVSPGNYILKPDIPNNTRPRQDIQPGQIKLKDINGDGQVDTNDKTVIGRGLPIHIGGFTNNFEYKNFDLNIFFQWSYGNDVLNANRLKLEYANATNTNQFALVADRWTPRTVDAEGNVTEGNYSNEQWAAKGGIDQIYTSKVVEDASYIRLKTVQLGYNIPQKSLKKIGIYAFRVYITGQNLYTWTNYSGYDPEVSIRNTALTQGFDYSSYPRTRTFLLGCKLTF